jgi:prepilin peptidase CpaA
MAAFTDLRERRIPNWLTVAGLIAGFAIHWPDPLTALQGAALAFTVHIPFFWLRALGGGDVKLMTALGAIVGPRHWLTIFAFSAVLGGALALALVYRQGALRLTLTRTAAILASLSKGATPGQTLNDPHAIKLPRGAVAALAVILWAIIGR